MRKNKLFIVGIPALVFGLILSGCPTESPDDDPVIDPASTLIGIAMPESNAERWKKDGEALKSYAESKGYKTELAFGNADQAVQNKQIEDFLTNGAKLIVASKINDGVGTAIAAAASDNVAVIAYDRLIMNSGDYDYYITFNNFKVGQFQGQGIEQALNLKAAAADNPKYITLFAGSLNDNNAKFFFDGAMNILNPYIEKGALIVVGPNPKTSADANFSQVSTEDWDPNNAKTRMESLLSGGAKDLVLDAVLAPNDSIARAIIEACLADDKYTGKLPVITGQDAEFASALLIKEGKQYMTVFKNTAKLAEAAIILADQILKRQTLSVPGADLASGSLGSIGNTGTKTVKAYILEPILVTKENLNVVIDAGYFSAEQASQLK
ncbi:MAG: sugar-binding protein [Treponema sp.]|jgi:putative multiple sugar transport system substrate-binding protein|nr:sugar-binding protein [Treponema sp.]